MPEGILYKGSNLTDLVSASAVGFSLNLLVSEKLSELSQQFQSIGMQFFQTQLHERNGLSHNYSLVHPYIFSYELLDFETSDIGFYKDNVGLELLNSISVSDVDEFKNVIAEYEHYVMNSNSIEKYLIIKHPMFKKDIRIDFCALQYVYGGTGLFVSERLRKEIERMGCTGIVLINPGDSYP